MTLWHLKLFVDVAELGSMSAAARKNDVRQPSVSQKITELERHYGVLLFERLGNRLQITASGKKLLDIARDLVGRFAFLEEFMEAEHHSTRLRIGATITVGSSIFPDIIRRYREENPMVEVYGATGNTAAICHKLMHNELDIALVEGKVKAPELVSLPRIRDFLVLACGREHPFFTRQSISSRELCGMEFVMREPGSGTRELFEQYAAAHDVTFRTALEFNSPDAIRQAICVNGCLAVLSARLLTEALREGSVRAFRCAGWARTFNLVYHKNKHMTAAIRRFCELLTQYEAPPQELEDSMCGLLQE